MPEAAAAPNTPLQSMLGAATANLAKFKAEQDVGLSRMWGNMESWETDELFVCVFS